MIRGVDYIGVGVGAIIVDDRGRLFLARRGLEAKNERGLWEFPGGAVERGERLADALRRDANHTGTREVLWHRLVRADVPRELTAISHENLENYVRFIARTSLKVERWH